MGSATVRRLSLLASVGRAIQGLWAFIALTPAAAPAGPQRPPVGASRAATPPQPQPVPRQVQQPQRPLRVVQVLDRGQSRQSAGRMVICGRMADVCAELDRLAACAALCPD